MFSTATLSDVLDFITDEATDEDIDRIYDAARLRNKALGAKRAASVRVGALVKIDGISPKYFNGLTGVVMSIDGQRARVRFDKASTDVLRYKGARRYHIPYDTDEYTVGGLPLSTCQVA